MPNQRKRTRRRKRVRRRERERERGREREKYRKLGETVIFSHRLPFSNDLRWSSAASKFKKKLSP